jgi:hypothetical protein
MRQVLLAGALAVVDSIDGAADGGRGVTGKEGDHIRNVKGLHQALLFHGGNYVGTATSKAYGLVSLNSARTTDDTVALDYKDPKSSAGDANPTVVTVRYQWQGDRVARLDPPPPW